MSRQAGTDESALAQNEAGSPARDAIDRRTRERLHQYGNDSRDRSSGDESSVTPRPEERLARVNRLQGESTTMNKAPSVDRAIALEDFSIDHSPVAFLRQREGRQLDPESTRRVRGSLEAHQIGSAADLDARGIEDVWDLYSKPVEAGSEGPRIDGFQRSAALEKEVRSVLGSLPREHVAGLDRVSYTDTFKADDQGVLLGQYDRETNCIEINRQSPDGKMDGDRAGYTVTHEVGHHVYWHRLTDQQREQWDGISRASLASEYVTDYAKSNTRDDFAESYAFHVLHPEVLKDTSAAKAAFLEEQWTSD